MTFIDQKRMDILNQSSLKDVLQFDSETGQFFWRNSHGRKAAGDKAGVLNGGGYISIRLNGYSYLAHRLAWLYATGSWPKCQIDHINRVRSDNRIVNLREATSFDNMQNRPIRADNRSGYPGVYFDKNRNKWRAEIYYHRKKMQIGMFHELELAIFVREHVDAKIKGEFLAIELRKNQ